MNKVFKLSELTNYISRLISEDVFLSNLKVSGEISNFNHHSSGHMYFTLKDEHSKVRCIMFKSYNEKLDITLKDGMEVILKGNISVYEREGQYQLYVKSVEIAGMGNLFLEYERLKKELGEVGLFDPVYKKEIPKYPNRIGIVTSATGAALQDMLNVIKRRYPIAKVYIYPTLVQGQEASKEIIKGLICLDNYNLDTIILGRGGGAIEDLFAFNDEDLAKIIFAMKTPIITGIGHEIDFTIADFVSDLRAPTPSAAAELATPDIMLLKENLYNTFISIYRIVNEKLNYNKNELFGLEKDLNYYNPMSIINENYQNLDYKYDRILKNNRLGDERSKLNLLEQRINSINPKTILDRGYSILLEDDNIIDSEDKLKEDTVYRLKLKDGEVDFTMNFINK